MSASLPVRPNHRQRISGRESCMCSWPSTDFQRAIHIISMRALVSETRQSDKLWASRVRFHIERLQAALPARGRGAESYRAQP